MSWIALLTVLFGASRHVLPAAAGAFICGLLAIPGCYAGVGVFIDSSFGCNLVGVLASSSATELLGKRDLLLFATDQCFEHGPATQRTFYQFVCAQDGTNTVSLQQCDRRECRGTSD